MTQTVNVRRRPGWWYPYIYVGAFGVVLAVNLVFMASAIRTFSGLDTDQAYEKGLKYNDTLAKEREQAKLGWTTHVELEPNGGGLHAADVVVSFTDRDGHPVTGLAGQVKFLRPTVAGHDSQAGLAEQGGGRYVVTANLPLGGQWDMELSAQRGDVTYQLEQRIVLP